MGFFSRWRWLSKPRAAGSGKIWDNINTPGSTGGGVTSRGNTLLLVRPHGEVPNTQVYPLPNPEPYLKGTQVIDPNRFHSQPDWMQPRIPVQEPQGNGLWNVNSNDPQQQASSGQPTVQAPAAPVSGSAPTQRRIRDTTWDGANPAVIRKPQSYTPSQEYFNQRTPIPEFTTPSSFTHMVTTDIYPGQSGWEQAFVPEPGMRIDEVGTAPPTLLSRPINVVTNTGSIDGHRSPIKNAKAPKRQRSG